MRGLGMKFPQYCLLTMLILLQAPAWSNNKADADSNRVLRVCADPNNLPFSNRVRPQFYDSLKKQIDIILIFCVRSLNSLNH